MNNIIIQAISKGNLDDVREEILSNSSWNKYGFQYLKKSLEVNKPDIARFLLSMDCRVEKSKKRAALFGNYQSPLHLAVLGGYEDIVETLVNKGAPLIHDRSKATPLHYAVRKRNCKIIEILLERFGNVNDMTTSGQSALHIAVENNAMYVPEFLQNSKELQSNIKLSEENLRIIKLLLRKGANIHLKNKSGESPLHLAIKLGNFDVTNLLLEYDSSPLNNDFTLLHTALKNNSMKRPQYFFKKFSKIIAEEDMGFVEDFLKTQPDTVVDEFRSICKAFKSIQENEGRIEKCSMLNFEKLVADYINNQKLRIMEILIKHGASVNLVDNVGRTLLYYACEDNNKSAVKFLLHNGANSNLGDYKPINVAIRNKNIEMLLASGVDINLADKIGYTALNYAIEKEEIIQRLLEHGADPNAFEKEGCSPLQLDILSTNEQIIELLLQYGADVNAEADGKTALYVATEIDFLKAVRILLKYNPDLHNESNKRCIYLAIKSEGENSDDLFELLLEYGYTLNMEEIDTKKTLFTAIRKGFVNIVQYLFDNGIDVDFKNDKNQTAFFVAAGFAVHEIQIHSYNYEKMFDLLLRYKADVNVVCSKVGVLDILSKHFSMNGFFYKAKYEEHVALFNDLCSDEESEAVVSFEVEFRTALQLACERNNGKVVQCLLEHGANPNIFEKRVYSPLQIAVLFKNPEIVKLLLQHGADVNVLSPLKRQTGYTLLHLGSKYYQRDIFELLLNTKLDVNACTENGYTPLHIAVKYKNISAVEVLLINGADVNAKTKEGITPLYIATVNSYLDVVKLIIKHNPDLHNDSNKSCIYLPLKSNEENSDDLFEALVEYGFNFDSKDIYVEEIFTAIKKGFVKIVKYFLDQGVSIDAKTRGSKNVLHIAVKYDVENTILLLLNYANTKDKEILNFLVNSKDHKGKTPIFYAKHAQITKILIKFGAKINVQDLNGNTPLHEALKNRNIEIVKTLLRYDANMNLRNKDGMTAIYLYAMHSDGMEYKKNMEFITPLLLNIFNVNVITNEGNTFLDGVYPSRLEQQYEFIRPVHEFVRPEHEFIRKFKLHIVKMYAANFDLSKCNLQYIEEVINAKEKASFLKQCKLEVENLKIENADKSVSFYDILKADMNQSVIYARNMNIIVELSTPDFKKRFPIYGELILCKFRKASNRKNLQDECCKRLCLICEVFLALPFECIEIIISFLDNDDLRNMLPDSVIASIYDI